MYMCTESTVVAHYTIVSAIHHIHMYMHVFNMNEVLYCQAKGVKSGSSHFLYLGLFWVNDSFP